MNQQLTFQFHHSELVLTLSDIDAATVINSITAIDTHPESGPRPYIRIENGKRAHYINAALIQFIHAQPAPEPITPATGRAWTTSSAQDTTAVTTSDEQLPSAR